MLKKSLLLVMCIMLLDCVFVFAKENQKFKQSDVKAITTVLKKEVAKGKKDSIEISEIIGDYASAVVDISTGDGGVAYLKKGSSGWKVIAFGSMVTPEDLESDIPTEILNKLFKE